MSQALMADYPAPSSPERISIMEMTRSKDILESPNVGIRGRLERQGESMPRLGRRAHDEISSRQSTLSLQGKQLNQSMEQLKPMKAERSLMKMTGANILGGGSSMSSIDYGIIKDGMNQTQKNSDPYGSITVQDMTKKTAKAQFDGICATYPVPDTRPKLYKVHGQIDIGLNKKPKSTFLSEIIDKQKDPRHKRPGPSEYQTEKSFDYATQHSTKRHQWNKEKRSSIIDVIQKREKAMKGPADYTDSRKTKILGTYTQKTVTGQLMNETEFMAKMSPASNAYKPNFDVKSQAQRVPRANMNRDKSPKDPLVPLKKNDSPSPVSYKDKDANWKKMSTFRNSSFNYTISKKVKTSFLDENLKKKQTIPQVGHYKDDMDKFLKLSRGTAVPRYKQGR